MTTLLNARPRSQQPTLRDVPPDTPREPSRGWRPWSDDDVGSPAAVPLDVRVSVRDRHITVFGKFDLASTVALCDLMSVLIQLNPGDSTIDINGLSCIDARGLDCLNNMKRQLGAVGATFTVVGVAHSARTTLEIAGLGALLEPARSLGARQ